MTKTRGGRQKASALVDLADESKEWRAPLAPDTSSQPSTSTRSTRSTRSSNASSAATATVGNTAHNSDNNTSTNTNTTSTTTARKRSKKKKADETLRSDPDVIQALIEADYEANVDPYRGINPCFAISYNNGSQDGIDADIPWKKCDDTLTVDKLVSTKWKFISSSNNNETIVNVDEGEDYEESTNGGEDSNNNVALLVQCDCPTVDKWARDGMETYNKQLNAKKKKRGKKRKKSGSSENNNNSSSADEMKSGEDDDEDDDSIMILLGNNNNNDDAAKTVLKRGPHLICGERKKDSKNATLLHPCDYNPVCEYCFILYVCGHWIFLFRVLYAYPHF